MNPRDRQYADDRILAGRYQRGDGVHPRVQFETIDRMASIRNMSKLAASRERLSTPRPDSWIIPRP